MKTLANFTHIILDEVHERDKDMDFLLIIIRMLMAKEPTNIKVILMSATFDTNMVRKPSEFHDCCDCFMPTKNHFISVRKIL